MTAPPPPAKLKAIRTEAPGTSDKWHERLVRSGYFVGAVMFHLILFFMLATLIVFRPPESLIYISSFHPVTVPPAPPPTPPAPSGGEAANNLEPTVQTTPPPSAPSVISISVANDFTIKSVKSNLPNLPPAATIAAGSALAGHSTPGSGSGSGQPFGTAESSGAVELEGYLYDLKQTQDRQATNMDPGGYHNKIKEFIANDWNPGVLRDYYKSPAPLHTSSIFIPIINAADGPKAFGVEKDVQPNMYCVWYKVTATPTLDGTYRFVGVGDDILLVRVNHHTVLDGCDFTVSDEVRKKETKINMTNFDPTFGANGDFWVGTPFHATAHESVDIEVLIGEEPGGKSDYFLFIQRDESTYEKQANGSPLLPIFQLDPKPILPAGAPRSFPPFASTSEPWTAAAP